MVIISAVLKHIVLYRMSCNEMKLKQILKGVVNSKKMHLNVS